MAVTYIDHAGTQGQTDFAFTFPYLEDEHIKVEIDGVGTTDFTVVATPTAKIVLDTGLSAAASVRVRRRSAPNVNLVDFVNGSVLTEAELDLSYRHNRYLAEEIAELNDQSLQVENGGTQWDAKSLRIKNVGTATDTTDAVTKVYVDNKVAQVSTGATQPPLKWVFSATSGTNNTYTVTGAEVLGDTAYEVSIDGLIKEPTVEYTVDPSTDTLTIIPNMTGSEDIVVIQRGFGVAIAGTVGTNSLVDGSVTTSKLASGAVTADKISTTDTKFNVQSDGKVGIGTASPDNKLHVLVNNNDEYDAISYASAALQIENTNTTASSPHSLIHFRLDKNGGDGYLGFITDGTTNNTEHFVLGNQVGELLRVKSDGNVGIGTASPAHALDVSGDINITGNYKVNGSNLQTVPTGTVSAFAGSAAPTGYALCDGSAVNTYTQAALHAVVSDTYGGTAYEAGVTDQAGVNTTFNLPDLRGRVIAGQDDMSGTPANRLTNPASTINGINGDGLGNVGGHETHVLTEAQLAAHKHNYYRALADRIGQSAGTSRVEDQNNNPVETTSTGGDQAHNNVQPTIILNYIIKT